MPYIARAFHSFFQLASLSTSFPITFILCFSHVSIHHYYVNKYAPIISLGNISIKGNDIETSEYLGRSFCYMNNYTNDNTARRYTAHVNALGTTQIHSRNPYIIGWWSAAFPGFGHLLLSKYIHAFVLFIWEVVINLQANINLAIIY